MSQEPSNSVFISYRRNASGIYALAIYQYLTAQGIDAFYDIKSITAGQFGEIILGQITTRPYFLFVLTPGTLKRCTEEGDWLRREIDHALGQNRIIVPLFTSNFKFADLKRYIPDIAEKIKAFNGMRLDNRNMQYFQYALRDLVENFLKPVVIEVPVSSPEVSLEVAQVKEEISNIPPVSELELAAQFYFNRGLARDDNSVAEISEYTRAIDLKPDFVEAYYNRGVVREARSEYEKAIADYSEAIRLRPEYDSAYTNRGNAYRAIGMYDKAIADYSAVIHLGVDLPYSYYNRANAHQRKDDFGKAIEDYTEAIRLRSDFVEAYNNRGSVHMLMGNLDDALADYTEAIRIRPDFAAFNNRGTVFQKKGDLDQAVADYTQSILLNPKVSRVYFNRGTARDQQNDYLGAVEDFKRCLKIQPDHPMASELRQYIAKNRKKSR